MIIGKKLRSVLTDASDSAEHKAAMNIDKEGVRAYLNHVRVLVNAPRITRNWLESEWAARERALISLMGSGSIGIDFAYENELLRWTWANSTAMKFGVQEYTVLRKCEFVTFAGVATVGKVGSVSVAPVWRFHSGGHGEGQSVCVVLWPWQSGTRPGVLGATVGAYAPPYDTGG